MASDSKALDNKRPARPGEACLTVRLQLRPAPFLHPDHSASCFSVHTCGTPKKEITASQPPCDTGATAHRSASASQCQVFFLLLFTVVSLWYFVDTSHSTWFLFISLSPPYPTLLHSSYRSLPPHILCPPLMSHHTFHYPLFIPHLSSLTTSSLLS